MEAFVGQHFFDDLSSQFSFFLLHNHLFQHPQVKIRNQPLRIPPKILIQPAHIILQELLHYTVNVIRQERVMNIINQLRVVMQSGVPLFNGDLTDLFLQPAVHVEAFGNLGR